MDLQQVTALIGTLGFPIVACIALFWRLEVEQQLHREEAAKLTEVINDLKQAITELSAYIKVRE